MRDALNLEPRAVSVLNALLPPIFPSTLTRHSNPAETVVLAIESAGVIISPVLGSIAVHATPNGTFPTPSFIPYPMSERVTGLY